ncbi:hypothetical protein [Novosphingobium sp. TCA1]|jgi:hypothetical protein|uniref:hypothetical protein n=1 Tax=Novosphingobium sp. TCA1 TaxID=2682474 RepID=UPI001307FB06|nr:hypothetical protein [Novosphingobium sp. TCA1]GFE72353.1 hypothetical protein NTCA1_00020 [Novosphingobium sp. TCA1]
MSEKREQSPRWLPLLRSVLESCEADIENNAYTNDETFKRALSWLDVMMAGKPLSPRQATNFIDSVRKRVRGKANFSWNGPIALTQKQMEDERKFKRMERFTRVTRKRSTISQCLMEVVTAKLDTFDWSDSDKLAAFQAHIAAFDPDAAQAEEVEEVMEIEPEKPLIPNPILDDIMARFPHQKRFPSNMHSEEHMAEVHAAYSISGRNH